MAFYVNGILYFELTKYRTKGIEKYLSLRLAIFPMKRDKRTLIKFLFYKIVIVEISLNAYDENLLIFHIFRLHL